MKLFRTPGEPRIPFATSGLMPPPDPWRTGFGVTRWLHCMPALRIPYAAPSGLCPGLGGARLIEARTGLHRRDGSTPR